MKKILFLVPVLFLVACASSVKEREPQQVVTGDVGQSAGPGTPTVSPKSNPSVSATLITRQGNLIAKIGIAGSGKYVCSAEDSFQEIPVLGRGQSRKEAEIVALQECRVLKGDNGFFCSIINCEKDGANGVNINAVFDVLREKGRVGIGFKGKVKYACYSKGWDREYIAKAATKTEALAMAKAICADDEGVRRQSAPKGFFCSDDNDQCEQISGVKINFGNILDVFKGHNE